MRSSTRRKREREREWWRGFPVVICLTRRSAGLYKAESFALSSPSFRERFKWLVNIKRSKRVCVCALLLVKEWKVKRHHIYLKMRLISAGPSFPHTVWWGSNVGGCADLHAIPRRNVSFVSSKRENKRSFEWNDLNRREKVPKQQASAEKMQQRFCALHHSRPNDLDGDERKGT